MIHSAVNTNNARFVLTKKTSCFDNEDWNMTENMTTKTISIRTKNCAFTEDFKHKIIFFIRTISSVLQYSKQLDDYTDKFLLPSLTNEHLLNSTERKLLSLSVKFGGGINYLFQYCGYEMYELKKNN